MLNEPRDDLFGFLLLQDFDCHVVDCAVVKHDYTAVRAGFYMHTTILAKVVIAATEVITYCLNCGVESVCNLMHGAVGKAIFEPTEFVEGDGEILNLTLS